MVSHWLGHGRGHRLNQVSILDPHRLGKDRLCSLITDFLDGLENGLRYRLDVNRDSCNLSQRLVRRLDDGLLREVAAMEGPSVSLLESGQELSCVLQGRCFNDVLLRLKFRLEVKRRFLNLVVGGSVLGKVAGGYMLSIVMSGPMLFSVALRSGVVGGHMLTVVMSGTMFFRVMLGGRVVGGHMLAIMM